MSFLSKLRSHHSSSLSSFLRPSSKKSMERGFSHLDMADRNAENRSNGFLENELQWVSPRQDSTTNHFSRFNDNGQSALILENLYNRESRQYKSDYKMNHLGKYIAGTDGKISKAELKALDTDNNGKVSKTEYDAKRAEMESKQEQTALKKEQALVQEKQKSSQLQQFLNMLMQMFMGGGQQSSNMLQPQSNTDWRSNNNWRTDVIIG